MMVIKELRMIDMTPESILDCMRSHDYEADIQMDTQQVYTILEIEGKEYPVFLRVFDDGHLLQILAFIPSQLNKDVLPDMARLLHILNKELDVPGFGMDEMAGVIFYRIMLPAEKQQLDEELFIAFLKTINQVCKMFAAPIEAVSLGQMSLEQILNKAEEMQTE